MKTYQTKPLRVGHWIYWPGMSRAAVVLAGWFLASSLVPTGWGEVSEDTNLPRGMVALGWGGVDQSGIEQGEAGYGLLGVTLDLEIGPFHGSMKRLAFDWTRPGGFVESSGAHDPWGALHQVMVGVKRQGTWSERLMYEFTAGVASGFEEQIDDSITGFVGGYGIYSVNPMWSIMVGAFYSRHQEIETDFDFIPILGASWNAQATEGLSFSFGLPTTDVTWHFSETTRLVLDISSLEGGVYRLADGNPVRDQGYVELVSATASLRLETRISGNLELGVGIGHAFDREVKLYDRNGDNERTYDVEKKPGFMVSLSRSF